jgi:hypothetical protein
VFSETEAEETDLGAAVVASGALHQAFRAIADWVRPAWQGQGSVVRLEGRVRVFSGLLRSWLGQPTGLDYTLVSTSEAPPGPSRVAYKVGQVKVSSSVLRSWSGQPAAWDYKMVCLLDLLPAQVAVSTPQDTLKSGLCCAVVSSDDLSPGVLFTHGGVAFGTSSPNIVQRLAEHKIVLSDAQEVSLYLTHYPQLAQLLPKICAEIRQALGWEVELSLDVYKDPEIDDRYLTLYARKQKYEPDILDRLQAVSESFNHRLEEVPGYFLLATDFSAPRGTDAV